MRCNNKIRRIQEARFMKMIKNLDSRYFQQLQHISRNQKRDLTFKIVKNRQKTLNDNVEVIGGSYRPETSGGTQQRNHKKLIYRENLSRDIIFTQSNDDKHQNEEEVKKNQTEQQLNQQEWPKIQQEPHQQLEILNIHLQEQKTKQQMEQQEQQQPSRLMSQQQTRNQQPEQSEMQKKLSPEGYNTLEVQSSIVKKEETNMTSQNETCKKSITQVQVSQNGITDELQVANLANSHQQFKKPLSQSKRSSLLHHTMFLESNIEQQYTSPIKKMQFQPQNKQFGPQNCVQNTFQGQGKYIQQSFYSNTTDNKTFKSQYNSSVTLNRYLHPDRLRYTLNSVQTNNKYINHQKVSMTVQQQLQSQYNQPAQLKTTIDNLLLI